MNAKPLTKAYIESRSTPDPESGCWEWVGFRHKTGYGEIRRNQKRILAHRLSYFLWNGEWPDVCRHKCDNRGCVNPGHLENGTHADNVRDRIERGRSRHPRNEEHGRAKLSNGQVLEIFALRERGLTQQAIADHVGCHQTNVSRILLGRNRQL